MLTESRIMFFPLSRAILSAILREEYLTSAVRTKEGDKAGSSQPPASDPVQLSWNWRQTISFLTSKIPAPNPPDMYPCPIRMIAQSFQNFSRKAILKLQDQLSQHDHFKNLSQRHLRYARRFKSTNQRIATKQTSLCGAGLWFWTVNGRDTLILLKILLVIWSLFFLNFSILVSWEIPLWLLVWDWELLIKLPLMVHVVRTVKFWVKEQYL